MSVRLLMVSMAVAMLGLVSCGQKGSTELINNPATASNAEGTLPTEASKISFADTVFNFGTVTAGDTVKHKFKFTNTGEAPLVISRATASCGCTVPNYPKEPIAPGESGEIDVVFNTRGKLGETVKTVTVTANTNPSNTELELRGTINHPAEDGPVKNP